MKRIFLTLSLAMVAVAACPARLDFTYNYSGATPEGYGNAKTETYDVAIRLDNPSFVGAKLTGIRVAVPADGVSETSAWLSSALNLKKKNGKNVNNPDITSEAGTVTDGWMDITFPTPYTIPAEGVYVGYSFTVTDVNGATEKPVSVASGVNPDGLYLHSSRTKLRWGPMSEELGKVSTMAVTLEGTFPEHLAVLTAGQIQSGAGESATVTLPIVNCGTDAITSIDYTGTVDGATFSGSAVPAAPLSGNIGAYGTVTVEIAAVAEAGEYPLKLKVTKINGAAADCPETEGTLKVYPFLPVNRPLVEEYTGLWCGWCPRGYVALETMKERVGDLFIGVAYHNGDDMAFTGKTPNSPDGYPAGYINRSTPINLGKIYTDWDAYRTWIPDGGVDVTVEWADDSHSAVKATATTRFVEDHSGASYRLSYLLIADGLSNPEWKQHNSYSGKTDEKGVMPGHWGDIFINGKAYVEGLTFNDVAVAATDFDGEIGSVPAEIKAGEEYTHVHVFDLEGLPEAVLTAPEELRVVAVLTDGRSGKFINCNSSLRMNGDEFAVIDPAASTRHIDADRVETGRWTLDGRRINAPVKGVNIVRYSDGSVRKLLVVD